MRAINTAKAATSKASKLMIAQVKLKLEIVVTKVVIKGLAAIKMVFSRPTVEAKICRSTLVTSHWVILMETALAKAAKRLNQAAVSQPL